VLFLVPLISFLLTNAEVFLATLPLWFFIYMIWLIRTVIQNAATTTLRSPTSYLRVSRRKSSSPKPDERSSSVKQMLMNGKKKSTSRLEGEEEDGAVEVERNSVELSPRRSTAEEEKDMDTHLLSPSEKVSLLGNASP
jgi:hypothetical protein